MQAVGLCQALRGLGQPVVFFDPFDPFEATAGSENPDRIAETIASES